MAPNNRLPTPTPTPTCEHGTYNLLMGSISTETLERQLHALDADAFVEFVATLWRESGWTVDRAGDRTGSVLELSRQGASRRLLVLPPRRVAPSLRRAPTPNGRIDAVVAPYTVPADSALPRSTPAAEIVDVSGIRDRLYYALDDEPRERLLASQLGVRPDDEPGSSRTLGPLPPLRVTRVRGAAAASVGVLLLLAAVLLFVLATGALFGGSSSSGMVDATEPSSTGSVTTASAPVYDADRNCERGPGEVVQLSAEAVRGSSLSRGLVVMGDFWNPVQLQAIPSGVWFDQMQSNDRLAFYGASDLTLAEPTVNGDEAVVNATATDDGTDYPYRFELSEITNDSGEHCWVIDVFAPA